MITDVLLIAAGVFLLGYAVVGLVRGEISFSFYVFFTDRATRADHPSTFWTLIVVWIGLGGFLAIAGIREIVDRRAGLAMDIPSAARQIERRWRANNTPEHIFGGRGRPSENAQR